MSLKTKTMWVIWDLEIINAMIRRLKVTIAVKTFFRQAIPVLKVALILGLLAGLYVVIQIGLSREDSREESVARAWHSQGYLVHP